MMGILAQRKWFEHPELARAAADAFQDESWKIPGIKLTVAIQAKDGGAWLTLIQEGAMVTGDEPLLPDYEQVEPG